MQRSRSTITSLCCRRSKPGGQILKPEESLWVKTTVCVKEEVWFWNTFTRGVASVKSIRFSVNDVKETSWSSGVLYGINQFWIEFPVVADRSAEYSRGFPSHRPVSLMNTTVYQVCFLKSFHMIFFNSLFISLILINILETLIWYCHWYVSCETVPFSYGKMGYCAIRQEGQRGLWAEDLNSED